MFPRTPVPIAQPLAGAGLLRLLAHGSALASLRPLGRRLPLRWAEPGGGRPASHRRLPLARERRAVPWRQLHVDDAAHPVGALPTGRGPRPSGLPVIFQAAREGTPN
jgi:hypothetical protein